MDRRRIFIDDIHIGQRHREPDSNKVKKIAESIADVGLMNPPAVCIRNDVVMDDGEVCDGVAVLIYGRHRLAALKLNGEEYVDCIVHDVDDLHAELMEIDENLARAELSPAQEAAHIARRKEIWEEINGKETGGENFTTSLSDGRKAGPQHEKKFAAELAEITGEDKSGINRKLRRVDELGTDIHRIAGTSLDKGVEMDALIKLPPDTRAELIDRASKGEKVSARPAPSAKPAPAPKPLAADKALEVMAKDIVAASEPPPWAAEEDQFRALCRAWGDANGSARMRFLEWAGLSRH